MLFNFNYKAIGYGILAFLGLYIINVLMSPLLASGASSTGAVGITFWGVKQLMGIAVLLVPGFLAGRIATERGFTHGAITGVIGTILSALAATLVSLLRSKGIPISATALLWIITNALVCGLGGIAGEDPNRLKWK